MTKDLNKPRPAAFKTGDNLWSSELLRRRKCGPYMSSHISHGTQHLSDTDITTRAVHAGQYDDPLTGAVGTPIYQASTFLLNQESYDSIEEGRAREHLIYSRYGNPSQWSVQEKIASLENAESAIVFSSGMAAISSSVMSVMDRGAHLITSRDIYGGTYHFFNEDLETYGMSVSFVDVTNIDAIEAAITDKTKVLFFEAITNPLLKIAPIKAIVALAKKYKLRTIIDATFASPMNLNALDLGVDIVVHSGSKYLNGHTDLIAGVAVSSRKLMDPIWGQMLKFGGSLDPHACFLLERGLKTFGLRLNAHNQNALELAQFLEARDEITRVYYPGLPSHPQHQLAKDSLKGFSGMISFEIKGGDAASAQLTQLLQLPRLATSLGGVESLISLPHNTSQAALMKSQLREIGINDGLVRLSVGIENIDDLKHDFIQAFEQLAFRGVFK
jgi:cystathionine beta-lyase/cystathionine gamma-synthase